MEIFSEILFSQKYSYCILILICNIFWLCWKYWQFTSENSPSFLNGRWTLPWDDRHYYQLLLRENDIFHFTQYLGHWHDVRTWQTAQDNNVRSDFPFFLILYIILYYISLFRSCVLLGDFCLWLLPADWYHLAVWLLSPSHCPHPAAHRTGRPS